MLSSLLRRVLPDIVASKYNRKHFMRNTEHYNNLSYVSFKIVPLCKYTPVAASVKTLEAFLEAILWNHFPLFDRILNYFSNVTKAPSLQYCFQSREQKKSAGTKQEDYGEVSVLSQCNVYTICRQTQLSTRWYANLLNVNLNYMFRPQSLAIIKLHKRKLIN